MPRASSMSNKKLGIGVIGLGRLGSAYAKYFTGRITGATLVAVSDVNEPAASSLAVQLGVARVYARYQDLIADDAVEGVVIVSPTSTHREIVTEAANHGKPIFCEKPLSISLDEARSMLRTVEETNVFFQMGFMRRFDKGYVAARNKIEDGAIGAPVLFKSSSRDPYRPSLEYLDPAHSGGFFIYFGVYFFFIWRCVFGGV